MAMNGNEIITGADRKRVLRVQVTEGEKTKVNVNVPLSLAKIAMRFIPKDATIKVNEAQLDWNELALLLEHPDLNDFLVEVDDNDTKVKVFVE